MVFSQLVTASFLNISQTFANQEKLKFRNNYLNPCKIIIQMSDSFGNPKVSNSLLTHSFSLIDLLQEDCSASFSGTSISGNVSTISAVGCDPSGRTDSGDSINTLDGELGPVLKYCRSSKLNSLFTDPNMRNQDGTSIVKYEFCDLGGHQFVFNVDRSGTYIFKSKVTLNGQSHDLNLNVDVDSGDSSHQESDLLF